MVLTLCTLCANWPSWIMVLTLCTLCVYWPSWIMVLTLCTLCAYWPSWIMVLTVCFVASLRPDVAHVLALRGHGAHVHGNVLLFEAGVLLQNGHQGVIHVLRHLPTVAAHVEVGAAHHQLSELLRVLHHAVLHVHLLPPLPRECRHQVTDGAVLSHCLQLLLVEIVLVAVAAPEEEPRLAGGLVGVGFDGRPTSLQEPPEGRDSRPGPDHDHVSPHQVRGRVELASRLEEQRQRRPPLRRIWPVAAVQPSSSHSPVGVPGRGVEGHHAKGHVGGGGVLCGG
mmetsp:Transcript_30670/g.51645  ORF Transcript_30670/g.51645 Transcript_30670/m.51645 type:complete len:281 (+) Transcript_30670:82-924(+)